MKKKPSDCYLILSSGHLGISKEILSVFKQAAEYYKPTVIHLGPLTSEADVKQYNKLMAKMDFLMDQEESEKVDNAIEFCEGETQRLRDQEKLVMDTITSVFGKVEFIVGEDEYLKSKNKLSTVTIGGRDLSKYLYLSPILPSSATSINDPFSQRAMDYLRQFGKSCIAAHPVPSATSMPRIGINEAYNYWSVGSLRHQPAVTNTKSQSYVAHLPAAIIVLVDRENGEFHPKALHIDYLDNGPRSKSKPIILDDGKVFFENKTENAPSSDKANYVTDQHAKHWQPGVLASFRAVNTLHQPETIIDGGDTSDMSGSNRHAEGHPGEMLGESVRSDLIHLKVLLREMSNEKCIKNRIIIDSNHHEWLSLRCARDPALIGLLDWPTLAREMFSDWTVLIRKAGDNVIYHFGDLIIRHGDGESGVASGSRLSAAGKYLCGHLHRFKAFRRAIQLGCGCMLGPKYIGGKITSWQNMLATLTKYKGITGTNPKTILHDNKKDTSRFAYGNTIYEVPSHRVEVDLTQRIYAK